MNHLPQPEYYVSRRRTKGVSSEPFTLGVGLAFLILWFLPFIPVQWACYAGIGFFFLAVVARVLR